MEEWMDAAPRVRVRKAAQRPVNDILELAVLNERLAGSATPWEARQKLEYLKMRRRNWERIYEYVIKQDAAATLAVIEEASDKAEELLSEEARERNSVGALKEQLMQLQQQVDDAQQRLKLTQSRVDQNLQRISELKAEAMALEALSISTDAAVTTVEATSQPALAAAAAAATNYANAPAVTQTKVRQSSETDQSKSGTSVTSPTMHSSTGRAAVRDRGLSSSLEAEEGLRNFWYPAEFSKSLTENTMVPFELFDEPWVLFRDEHGSPACIRDECAHRACPLSLGKVVDGQVQCAYHGWQFNADGACTKMPSTVHCRHVGVSALPCVEKHGFIWVWPGDGVPNEVPNTTAPPDGYDIHAEILIDVPVEHGLLMENLLDLAHAPFTHTTTFARGWPVPEFVKFHANKLLSGNWDPYPIDMAFQPPCMVISRIGLAQPGKIMRGVTASMCDRHLHQLHVCMPSKRGHTRLLYRMSLDFMSWVRHVPFIDNIWKQVAGQVLGEDLVLVLGQQDRLARGGDTWANPVSYDKLAVRYRRWRNQVAGGDGAGGKSTGLVTMNAGELFRLDENEEFMDEAGCSTS
eukprot:jgi/Chrzof1/1986/Cz10g28270.t1_CAO1[v5.2]